MAAGRPALALLLLLPVLAAAQVHQFDCSLAATGEAAAERLHIVIDDALEYAQLQRAAATDPCAAARNCTWQVYRRTRLPGFIQLTKESGHPRQAVEVQTLELDRYDLALRARRQVLGMAGALDEHSDGQCTMRPVAAQRRF